MGATNFKTAALGKTAREAFNYAVRSAQYDHGHSGYSGTIAEKDSYVVIKDTPETVIAKAKASGETLSGWTVEGLNSSDPVKRSVAVADALVELNDERIHDKWGPAGAIQLDADRWLFFGWASE